MIHSQHLTVFQWENERIVPRRINERGMQHKHRVWSLRERSHRSVSINTFYMEEYKIVWDILPNICSNSHPASDRIKIFHRIKSFIHV